MQRNLQEWYMTHWLKTSCWFVCGFLVHITWFWQVHKIIFIPFSVTQNSFTILKTVPWTSLPAHPSLRQVITVNNSHEEADMTRLFYEPVIQTYSKKSQITNVTSDFLQNAWPIFLKIVKVTKINECLTVAWDYTVTRHNVISQMRPWVRSRTPGKRKTT